MQEVPIVATIAVIIGIDPIAVHSEPSMTTIDAARTAKMTGCVGAYHAGTDARADVIASSDSSDVSATAKSANVSATAAEAGAHATSVAAAAEAAAHATSVATAATSTAAGLCLHSQQTRRQQSGRQNGHHLSHRFSPLSYGTAPSTRRGAAPSFR